MKRNQACHPYALAALLFLGSITYLSCHKAEQPLPVTSDTTPAAFFQVPENTVPAVSVIIHALNRLNEKSPFAETMIHNAGQPQWAFAKIKSNSSARETTGEQIINIPFVKEGTFKTSAILSVDITGADTSYYIFYPQHYLRYALGDDTTNANQQTANDFFSVFAGFDHDLFGLTEYRVNDGRIFGFDKEDKVEVTVSYPGETAARQAPGSSPNMAAADYIQICRTIKACVVATARCVSSVQCTYVWQEEGGTQPPPTKPSGGGSSGKPIAGGGSGTGGMLVPPCARTMNANGRELIASDLCNSTPWNPLVENRVENPCLKKMVDDAINKDCDNKITNIINTTFRTNQNLDLIFLNGPLSNTDGRTTVTPYPDGYTNISITLNSNPLSLPSRSEEYVAITIIHEAIHAWIDAAAGNLVQEQVTHEKMTKPAQINLMADALIEMYPNVSIQDARDLAWGGLQFTSGWTGLSQADKDRIIQTNADYKSLAKETACSR